MQSKFNKINKSNKTKRVNIKIQYQFETKNKLNLQMSTCTFFIKQSDNPPNLEQIKDKLSKGSLQQKCKSLKDLVKCIVSDQTYPPIIMHIISTVIPIQHQSQQLRKIMLLYWQVIEKCKSPTDKNLKEEIFLACNSLRNDLLCHNEYVRGRTLRLISRIMHRGVIEPLASAITNNLEHKSSYVRRNAVVCLYNVFITFGSDVIGDIDDDVEELLLKETDLSTKRNAFLLLNRSNPEKALKYLEQQINFQAVQEIGDILQLAILKILKQKCKQDNTQKPKLLKIVNDFSTKASQSVKLQCAITSTSISNSLQTIKSSLYAYVSILTKTNQLNVKKIILDKLELICKNSNYLEEDLIQDLVNGLDTPSVDIKMKILHIIMTGITLKTSNLVVKQMENQLSAVKDDNDYLIEVIKILEIITFKFPNQHQLILRFIIQKVFPLQEILREGVQSTENILKRILVESQRGQHPQVKFTILNAFNHINSKELIKVVLNILGNFFNKEDEIQKVINKLKLTIGSLPICITMNKQAQTTNEKQEKQVEQKKVFKTVILEDGSYSTELVHEKNLIQSQSNIESSQNFAFRNSIAEDSIIGGIFARNISKLLYKIRKSQSFNKHACSILMILCSIIRYYEDNIFAVDQAIVQEISLLIRRIVNPSEFIKSTDEFFSTKVEPPREPRFQNFEQSEMIEKNPQDMINFRLLKKGGDDFQNFGFDDDQVNDITNQQTQKKDYITKLKSLVQLTGAFDPLYSEAFVTVNKYDIFFEILVVNTTKNNLLNIQVEFSSPAPILILQKAQCVNLRSKQSAMLRTQLRFSGSQFGVIYGYVNFDSHAGLEQPYLITQEINIDYMQFIQPARISEQQFKSIWQRISNQQIVTEKNIPIKPNLNFKRIVQVYEQMLHAKCVQSLEEGEGQEQYFLNCHLYGKSKLGEDFLINIALFSGEEINSTVTIRSKDQAVQQIVHKELLKCNFQNLDEDEEQEQQQTEK